MGAEASQPHADAAAEKSPWTSLEIVRLLLGAATPLALFALGFPVSQQAKHQSDLESQAKLTRETTAENNRIKYEAQIRQETAAREAEARRASAELQLRLRDLADRREADLRREGFARDESLRKEAFLREAAVRQAELARGEATKIIDRRIEFWDKLSSKLSQLNRIIDRVMIDGTGGDEVESIFRESDDLFGLYRPYFSISFEGEYESYKDRVRDFVKMSADPRTLHPLVVHDGVNIACNGYLPLRDAAAMEVAQSIGLAKNVTDIRASQPRRIEECERREGEALKKAEEEHRIHVAH